MPRRIAAGALFTAAVGLSVGAIAAPAQADAGPSHSPLHTTAFLPHQGHDRGFEQRGFEQRGFEQRSFISVPVLEDEGQCGCSTGHDEGGILGYSAGYGVRSIATLDRRDDNRYGRHRGRIDDPRECPPEWNGREGIADYAVDYGVRVDDRSYGKHRRECPPEWNGREGISGYDIDYGVRVDERGCDHQRRDDHGRDNRHDRNHHGHNGHGAHGGRGGHGGDGGHGGGDGGHGGSGGHGGGDGGHGGGRGGH